MEFSHLENWIDQINSGNLEQVVSLYSQDALLFATFDEKPLNSPALIDGYFDSFLARDGAGVELDSASVCHSKLGENHYSSTGLYTFFFKEGDQHVRQKARFTFIFNLQKTGSIIHHHSSVIPA